MHLPGSGILGLETVGRPYSDERINNVILTSNGKSCKNRLLMKFCIIETEESKGRSESYDVR